MKTFNFSEINIEMFNRVLAIFYRQMATFNFWRRLLVKRVKPVYHMEATMNVSWVKAEEFPWSEGKTWNWRAAKARLCIQRNSVGTKGSWAVSLSSPRSPRRDFAGPVLEKGACDGNDWKGSSAQALLFYIILYFIRKKIFLNWEKRNVLLFASSNLRD